MWVNNNAAEQDRGASAVRSCVGHNSDTPRCQRWRGPGPGQIRTRDQSWWVKNWSIGAWVCIWREGERPRQGWAELAVSLAKSQHTASGARHRQVTHLNSIPRDSELDDDKNSTMSLASCGHLTVLASQDKQSFGNQKVPLGAFWCLSPECGEEMETADSGWQWGSRVAPGHHHGHQASAAPALSSPPWPGPTDKLKAVSNFGIPIFHISLFWQSEMFKSQIFTLDTSYEGPRLWIDILPSYSPFIFNSKCLAGPFRNNLLRIVSGYSLSPVVALRLWSERILFWPLRCIFMENYRLGEFKKCVLVV